MKAAIVVPTVRPECAREFLQAWRNQFAAHHVIVVEDHPNPTFSVSDGNIRHFSWAEIDSAFGADSWIFPRKTDGIRSYGFYKAWQMQPAMIVTLDDDCFPLGDGFIEDHFRQLDQPAVSRGWVSTGSGAVPRGVPYDAVDREYECVLNHGLWTNIPDLDAITVLAGKRQPQEFAGVNQTVPKGMYFPMCGMNVAWKPELTPAMYFLLMGMNWPFDRWGDIWCGILVKKVCDHLNLGVKSGDPYIEHRKKSDQWANLARESSGYEVNETFWRAVDSVVLSAGDIRGAYKQLAELLPLEGDYWTQLRRAMRLWADIFCGTSSQTEGAMLAASPRSLAR